MWMNRPRQTEGRGPVTLNASLPLPHAAAAPPVCASPLKHGALPAKQKPLPRAPRTRVHTYGHTFTQSLLGSARRGGGGGCTP